MIAANKSNLINFILGSILTVSLLFAVVKELDKPQVLFSMTTGEALHMIDNHGVKTRITKDSQLPTNYEKVWVNR